MVRQIKKSRNELESILESRLSAKSCSHCLRTRDTAVALAKRFGVDEQRAAEAALLHDYAKDLSGLELLRLSEKMGLAVIWVEERNPYLLHARLGAALAEKELGISDPAVLGAIRKHTYGDPFMSDLDKVVYLADVIEPGRKFAGLEEIRELAATDLKRAFKAAYLKQILFVFSKGAFVHPTSVDVWNRLLETENNLEPQD